MINKMYKVEFKSKDNKSKFMVVCTDKDLDYWKGICKSHSKEGVCFYRSFPLTGSKKIYF